MKRKSVLLQTHKVSTVSYDKILLLRNIVSRKLVFLEASGSVEIIKNKTKNQNEH